MLQPAPPSAELRRAKYVFHLRICSRLYAGKRFCLVRFAFQKSAPSPSRPTADSLRRRVHAAAEEVRQARHSDEFRVEPRCQKYVCVRVHVVYCVLRDVVMNGAAAAATVGRSWSSGSSGGRRTAFPSRLALNLRIDRFFIATRAVCRLENFPHDFNLRFGARYSSASACAFGCSSARSPFLHFQWLDRDGYGMMHFWLSVHFFHFVTERIACFRKFPRNSKEVHNTEWEVLLTYYSLVLSFLEATYFDEDFKKVLKWWWQSFHKWSRSTARRQKKSLKVCHLSWK